MKSKLSTGLFFAVLAIIGITLLSGMFVANSVAKYTTSEDSSGSASVAKWGVTITPSTDNPSTPAFNTTYTPSTTANGITNIVKSDAPVVAPGTSGKVSLDLAGTPEVAVKITTKYTVVYGAGWEEASVKDYKPIKFYIGAKADNKEISAQNEATNTLADGTNIRTIEIVVTSYVDAGAGLGTSTAEINWEWAFTGNDDAKDTALADLAIAGKDMSVTLSLSTTVEQVI